MRRWNPALNTLMTVCVALFSGVQVRAQETVYCADFWERLPAAAGLSSKAGVPHRFIFSLEALRPWPRPASQVHIGTVTFTSSLPVWEINRPHGLHIGKADCGNRVINRFEVQGTTYSLTLGWSRDVCDGNPELRWEAETGKQFRVAFPKAYASNIEAVWCLKDHLAFGLGLWHNFHIRSADAVGLWNLKTGDFQFIPLVLTEMGYVFKWTDVQAGEGEGVVVFKSSGSAFAFWPDTHSSAPLDLASWTSAAHDDMLGGKEALRLMPYLATREFVKTYERLTEVQPLRPTAVELTGKQGAEVYHCVCAMAQDPAHWTFDYQLSFEENARHSQVGCFLLSQKRPAKILKVDVVPTRRWLDYTVSCSQGETGNEVVLTFKGDTYGDQEMARRYRVDPDAWSVESVTESSGE